MPKGTRRVAEDRKFRPTFAATSPPQTPATSPTLNRKGSPSPRRRFPVHNHPRQPFNPLAEKPKRQYGGSLRQEEISPQSSPSSSSGSEYVDADSPPRSISPARPPRIRQPADDATSTRAEVSETESLDVEEMSDFDPMDSDNERLNVLRPNGFEYPDSDRSRSRPRPLDLDGGFLENMQNLTCSNDSDEYDVDSAAHEEFVRRQKEVKRQNRMSHGSSIGKRTISDRGDSDMEDLRQMEPRDGTLGDRRTRRRVGDRRSGHFQDAPPDRIPELEEPNTSDDGEEYLARELPYYGLEVMEVDSDY